MLVGRILAGSAALVLAAGAAAAEPARPTVEWLMWGMPPYHLPDGAESRGVVDGLVDWLAERLPQYDHLREYVSNASKAEILKTRDLVCAVAYFKTDERAAFTQYTRRPPFVAAPLRLFVADAAAARFERFRGGGGIELAALVADGGLAGGREAHRAYTPSIDALLDRTAAPGALTTVPDSRSGFGMLAAGRLDWLIDYPEAAAPALASAPASFRYRTFPIAGADTARGSYIGCSKMPGGIALVAEIDRLLATAGPHPAWQAAYENWLDPERQVELRQYFIRQNAGVAAGAWNP